MNGGEAVIGSAVERILRRSRGVIERSRERVVSGERKAPDDAAADRDLQAVVVRVVALIADADGAVAQIGPQRVHVKAAGWRIEARAFPQLVDVDRARQM